VKILVAPDKFKNSLSAMQASMAIADSLGSKGHVVQIHPLADGGEGTSQILTQHASGRSVNCMATDPLGRKVDCTYGLSSDGKTAFIEMAQASGLWRLNKNEMNPEITTTFGTGELILHALKNGSSEIILGCGGSATHDGGTGMAVALGWKFFDHHGKEFLPVGSTLVHVKTISDEQVHPFLSQIKFKVISDVTNPLTGPEGAAHTFGPQKGATPEAVFRLDVAMTALDLEFSKITGHSFQDDPGAGAGGGMGAGARFFLNASWESGIAYVIRNTHFEKRLAESDLVFSGEGRLDAQSLNGKVISGVSELCKKWNKRLWIICGSNALEPEHQIELGIERIISLEEISGNRDLAIEQPDFWIKEALKGVEI